MRKKEPEDTEAVNTHVLFDWVVAVARKTGVGPTPSEITRASGMKSKELQKLVDEMTGEVKR